MIPSRLAHATLLKGHGTENDFVLLVDVEGQLDPIPEEVAQLCSRRRGIGADGLLRVVRARDVNDVFASSSQATWFMDYRNADGSVAEMCGNGSRVFAHYLCASGLATENTFLIGTRAGDKRATVESFDAHSAVVAVEMGHVEVTGLSTCSLGETTFAGLGVDVGNPHLACIIPGLTRQQLAALPIDHGFRYDEEFFPQGVNVEIATELCDSAVSMRVNERGVGETRSCGTGTVATAMAALADAGLSAGTVSVHVPGGTVTVTIADGEATLRGPSELVFTVVPTE